MRLRAVILLFCVTQKSDERRCNRNSKRRLSIAFRWRVKPLWKKADAPETTQWYHATQRQESLYPIKLATK